ncbi:jg23206, partial [Pararge aegeria aegeria]
LWDVGLDYAHGTGHGVGHFLNVHEGPAGVSWRPYPHDPGLKPGQILSNEPGYYKVGEYGIRHEDLVETIAVTKDTKHHRHQTFAVTRDTKHQRVCSSGASDDQAHPGQYNSNAYFCR